MIKIKNTLDTQFVFESTHIDAGAIIEVEDNIAQRLLALYWHQGLELIDDAEIPQEANNDRDIPSDIPTETPVDEGAPETHPDTSMGIICPQCHKECKNEKGLEVHTKKVHK